MAEERLREVSWDAPEHTHTEKGSDWYFAVGIIAVAAAGAAVFFGNFLFGILILLSAVALSIAASREPKIITHTVSIRGVRLGTELLPYSRLDSYYIDEEDHRGPQLFLKSSKIFMPLIVVPLPEDAIDDVESILEERLPEEHLEESLGHLVLEYLGF